MKKGDESEPSWDAGGAPCSFAECRRPTSRWLRLHWWQLAFGIGIACALSAPAQDAVKVTTNYYIVSASTVRELRANLDQSRPWKESSPVDAKTEWNIQWTFSSTESETGCRLRSFETKTGITITLPKWVPGPETSPALVQRWDNYVKALMIHERGHCSIAQAAAAELRKRVRTMKQSVTCQALAESINQTANQAISEYRTQDVHYDRKTDHGAAQGARFP